MRDGVPGVDPSALDSWYAAHVDGARPPLDFEVITGGHSNITYRVTDAAGQRTILRRPPMGHVLASAHDMAREHRIITAVGPTAVPVPATLGLCTDAAVNGAPFYVMELVDGLVVTNVEEAATLADGATRRRLGFDHIDVLADLHAVDVDAAGLGDFARKEGFLARQLKRWKGQWQATRTRDLPVMDQAYDLLAALEPPQVNTGIVHGDFRLGNLISRPDGTVAAVLDWELCTLGDVLSDLGYLLNMWVFPEDADAADLTTPPPTFAPGFPSRDELVERYAARTGFDVSGIAYYRAFNYWRRASIAEGVKRRYQEGVMVDGDVKFDEYELKVAQLAQQSVDLALVLHGGR